jgi:hypothetical protein
MFSHLKPKDISKIQFLNFYNFVTKFINKFVDEISNNLKYDPQQNLVYSYREIFMICSEFKLNKKIFGNIFHEYISRSITNSDFKKDSKKFQIFNYYAQRSFYKLIEGSIENSRIISVNINLENDYPKPNIFVIFKREDLASPTPIYSKKFYMIKISDLPKNIQKENIEKFILKDEFTHGCYHRYSQKIKHQIIIFNDYNYIFMFISYNNIRYCSLTEFNELVNKYSKKKV